MHTCKECGQTFLSWKEFFLYLSQHLTLVLLYPVIVTVYVTEFGLCADVRKKMRQVVTYLAFLVILAPAAVAFFIPPACVSFPKIGCGWPPCPLCPCVQIKPTFGLCQQCARPHMIALTCCENMPVAMNDVIIPKTAVVATITTNSRKFILSILYYHKIYNIYEVL